MFGFNVWRVLSWIPGFESLHAPSHIFVLGQLSIAIAATWVVGKGSEIFPLLGKRIVPLCCVLAAIHLVQMWPSLAWNWRSADEDVVRRTLEATTGLPKAPIAVLSSKGTVQLDELIAARSAHPVLNGGGHFTPDITAEWLMPQMEHCDTHACIDLLQGLGVQFLLVNTSQIEPAAKSFISRSNLVKKINSEGPWDLYQFDDSSNPRRYGKLALGNLAWWRRQLPFKTDQCVPPSGVKTSERPERSTQAADGMIGTVWLTKGPQSSDQWVEFPLGAEFAGQDVVLDLDVGFDGELSSGTFARALEIKWVKPTGLVKEEIVEIQLSLKEPLVLLQQIKVKVPADATGLRLNPLSTSSAAPAWGIAESRLCRLVM